MIETNTLQLKLIDTQITLLNSEMSRSSGSRTLGIVPNSHKAKYDSHIMKSFMDGLKTQRQIRGEIESECSGVIQRQCQPKRGELSCTKDTVDFGAVGFRTCVDNDENLDNAFIDNDHQMQDESQSTENRVNQSHIGKKIYNREKKSYYNSKTLLNRGQTEQSKRHLLTQ